MTGALVVSGCAPAQAQSVYQLTTKAKYVKAATEDTVTATGSANSRRTVLITAETVSSTANKDLITYLSNSATNSTKDANTYFKVQNGKAYRVSFTGNRVYRKASADSVFSQCIFGDAELMGNINAIPDIKFTQVLKTNSVLVESFDAKHLTQIMPMLMNRRDVAKIFPKKLRR